MEILESKYGYFPGVLHLNSQFIPGRKMLKLTIITKYPRERYKRAYPTIIEQLVKLFPTLIEHQCCGVVGNIHQRAGDCIDIIHIIEHIIIDLQCHILNLGVCSGITCNYWDPDNKYDVFVECPEERIGIFSALLAINIIKTLLKEGRLDPKYRRMIELAKYLYKRPLSVEKISTDFGWPSSTVNSLIEELKRFQFFKASPSSSE